MSSTYVSMISKFDYLERNGDASLQSLGFRVNHMVPRNYVCTAKVRSSRNTSRVQFAANYRNAFNSRLPLSWDGP